jgi:hypothetical protein
MLFHSSFLDRYIAYGHMFSENLSAKFARVRSQPLFA